MGRLGFRVYFFDVWDFRFKDGLLAALMPALPARGCGGDDAANGPDADTKGDKKENKRRKEVLQTRRRSFSGFKSFPAR